MVASICAQAGVLHKRYHVRKANQAGSLSRERAVVEQTRGRFSPHLLVVFLPELCVASLQPLDQGEHITMEASTAQNGVGGAAKQQ